MMVLQGDRAFGVPSIRTDIPAPDPLKRSLANSNSYGDEAGLRSVTLWFNSVHTRCIVKTSGFTRGVYKNRRFY